MVLLNCIWKIFGGIPLGKILDLPLVVVQACEAGVGVGREHGVRDGRASIRKQCEISNITYIQEEQRTI